MRYIFRFFSILLILTQSILCLQSVLAAEPITSKGLEMMVQLPLLEGRVRTGMYFVRVSRWSTETLQSTEMRNGLLNFDSESYLGYKEELKIQASTNGLLQFTLGEKSMLPKDTNSSYLQVEFRPAGTEPKHFQTIDASSSHSGIQRYNYTLPYKKHEFEGTQPKYFSGVLTDKNGAPDQNPHMVRFSLWRSSDADFFFDQFSDESINVGASNYLWYVLEKEVKPNEMGKFSTDISFLLQAAISLAPRDVYLQVEVREKNSTNMYQLIDPDSDVYSSVDRFDVTDGSLKQLNSAMLSPIGNTGKWLTSEIPAGATRNHFELGLSNNDPNAMIEIRANQGDDKKGVLRFNGVTNKWEVSSDGEVFYEIATGYSNLLGTPEDSFTIGLGDLSKDSPWKLQFGGGLDSAALSFDPLSNTFSFNRSVDFQQNELQNAVLENRTNAPQNPKAGQQYFNVNDRKAYYFDGSTWVAMSGVVYNSYAYGGGGTTNTVYVPTPSTPVDNTGTLSSAFTFNNDLNNNSDVVLVAGQQSGSNGKLRYNGTTKIWEVSNDGTLFSAIGDISSPQTLTNKTIDGDQNTLTNIDFSSLKLREKSQVFTAQYPGAVLQPSGTASKGTMESLFDAVGKYTYYAWSTMQATLQMRDIVISWKLPDDFDSFTSSPLLLQYRTTSTDTLDSYVGISLYDGSGNAVALVPGATSTLVNGWEQKEFTLSGSPSFSPGDTISMIVTLGARSSHRAEVATMEMNYMGK